MSRPSSKRVSVAISAAPRMALAASRESLIVNWSVAAPSSRSCRKWRGELRVLRGHQGSESSGGSREGEQAGAYSVMPAEEPHKRGYRKAQLDDWWPGGCDGALDCLGRDAQVFFQ